MYTLTTHTDIYTLVFNSKTPETSCQCSVMAFQSIHGTDSPVFLRATVRNNVLCISNINSAVVAVRVQQVHAVQHCLKHDKLAELPVNSKSVFILVPHDGVMFQLILKVVSGVEGQGSVQDT